jgi:hypothetical protein
MSKDDSRVLEILVLFLYAGLITVSTYLHEPFRDEAQAWFT